MNFDIVLLVLASAAIHPFWNLLIKKNPNPEFGFLILIATVAIGALIHGLLVGADFSSGLAVLPLLALSVCGQVLYGTSLTATLKRGDLSAYYPIIRASPVFVVVVSFIFLGQTYSLMVLLGIGMAVLGSFLLLYRRGTNMLDNPAALGFSFLALSGSGIYSLADSHLMETISPQVMTFYVDSTLVPIFALLWVRRRRAAGSSIIPQYDFSPLNILLPGVLCYASHFLVLSAYRLGGDVAAVTSIRQASILISVVLGGLFLKEGAMARRFFAAGLLAIGIVVIAFEG